MLYSLSLPSSSPSYPPAKPLKPRHLSPSPHPSHYIKFRTAHHENLRLTFLCPELLSLNFDITDVEPVFQFLTDDLHASVQESRGLVIKCPRLLFSDVEYFLRPTLNYLRQLGVNKLNVPSNLNAHLLNIRVEQMQFGKEDNAKALASEEKECQDQIEQDAVVE
ncbi:hypothetical protein D5086_008946 [Populus alba]|uniref:Uncharacterized protein n=1 Tax=Populus alba TaxID=43335 RepID=A0ACC4CI99_POPAL